MKTVNLKQGTQEWLAFRKEHFTASDAPAMLGYSKYKTRDELLHEKSTGETSEVTPQLQKLFDKGHKTEAMARPLAEAMANDEFFPATGVSDDHSSLAASFDGITMCESELFEHKLWNEKLADYITFNNDLPDTHWPQVEQQILVSGATRCLFIVSDGTEEKRAFVWYSPKEERAKQVVDGWEQFKKDLDVYTPVEKVEKLEAEPVKDLPAVTYNIDLTNGLALTSNLDAFKDAALILVERSKESLETDQDFANAEAMVKTFKASEGKIEALCEQVLGEVTDIDSFTKDLQFIGEQIRQARLSTDKQVKKRKEELKREILIKAQNDLAEYVNSLGVVIPTIQADFAGSMKGKKTVTSLQGAVNDVMASAKISADNWASLIKTNIAMLNELAVDHMFLFSDINQISLKPTDDFIAVVKTRVSDHKEEEEKKLEAQREAIRKEEQAKATLKAENEVKANELIKSWETSTEDALKTETSWDASGPLSWLQGSNVDESILGDRFDEALGIYDNCLNKITAHIKELASKEIDEELKIEQPVKAEVENVVNDTIKTGTGFTFGGAHIPREEASKDPVRYDGTELRLSFLQHLIGAGVDNWSEGYDYAVESFLKEYPGADVPR